MSSIPINSKPPIPTFTFADLEKAVSGSYNRGEIRLNQKGALEKLNNHVWFTSRNTDISTAAENIAVRNAVYQSILDKFGREGAASGYLEVAREFLLGDANFARPLSRDEVRAVISQLKSQTTDLESAKSNLAKLTVAHRQSDDKWTELSHFNEARENEVTSDTVKNDRQELVESQTAFDSACGRIKTALANLDEKLGAVFSEILSPMAEKAKTAQAEAERFQVRTNPDGTAVETDVQRLRQMQVEAQAALDAVEMLRNLQGKVKDANAKVGRCVDSVIAYEGMSKKDCKDYCDALKNGICALKGVLDECAKACPPRADELKQLGRELESLATDLQTTKKDLVKAKSSLAQSVKELAGRQEVDQLVKTRDELNTRIARKPANVEELKGQLNEVNERIRKIRAGLSIDDGRRGGTLTFWDKYRLNSAQNEVADRTNELKRQVEAAQQKLNDVQARQLGVDDFAKKLADIRRSKESGPEISVNESQKAFKLRWKGGLEEVMSSRVQEIKRKDDLSRQFLQDLNDNLRGELLLDYDNPKEQAKTVLNKIPLLLQGVADNAPDDGVRNALNRDIARIRRAMEKRMGDVGTDKAAYGVKNDFRWMLSVAYDELIRLYPTDSIEAKRLRKGLAGAIQTFSRQDFKVDLPEVVAPDKMSNVSVKLCRLAIQLRDANPVFKTHSAHSENKADNEGNVDEDRVFRLTHQAAKTLVAALKPMLPSRDYYTYETLNELADNVVGGPDGFGKFVKDAQALIKDKELRDALEEASTLFDRILDPDGLLEEVEVS